MQSIFFQAEDESWKQFELYTQARGLTATEALNHLLKLCVEKNLLAESFLIDQHSLKFSRTWFIHTIQTAFSQYNYRYKTFNIGRLIFFKTSTLLIFPRFKRLKENESMVIQVPEERINSLMHSSKVNSLTPIVTILLILPSNEIEIFYINLNSIKVSLPKDPDAMPVYLSPANRLFVRVRNSFEINWIEKLSASIDIPAEIQQNIQAQCLCLQEKLKNNLNS